MSDKKAKVHATPEGKLYIKASELFSGSYGKEMLQKLKQSRVYAQIQAENK